MDPILETKRTSVRRVAVDDCEFFFELMNSPGWLRYIGDRSVTSVDVAHKIIQESYLPVYDEFGFGYYVIEEMENRKPIGVCGFLKKPYLEHPDFGFAMLPEYHGKGLAREASEAVIEYGLGHFNLKVLDAVTKSENQSSIGLLERLGFIAKGDVQSDTDELLRLFRWSYS